MATRNHALASDAPTRDTPADFLDAQLEWLRNGGTATSKRKRLADARYAKAMARLERAETELARAFRKWAKLRDTVKRYDREQAAILKEIEAREHV